MKFLHATFDKQQVKQTAHSPGMARASTQLYQVAAAATVQQRQPSHRALPALVRGPATPPVILAACASSLSVRRPQRHVSRITALPADSRSSNLKVSGAAYGAHKGKPAGCARTITSVPAWCLTTSAFNPAHSELWVMRSARPPPLDALAQSR